MLLQESGLEHHLHFNLHPSKNIVVLIPSPSFTEKCCTFTTLPFTHNLPHNQKLLCEFLAIIASCISLDKLTN